MKVISQKSFTEIRHLINNVTYGNIKARLDQILPQEYSAVFSKVNVGLNAGTWYVDGAAQNINYLPYSQAGETEKEAIAIALEDCKNYVCENLRNEMPFIEDIFIIPSTDEIFWYHDDMGMIHVLLAEWGFKPKADHNYKDIISALINLPRKHTQELVRLRFFFSDGELARDVPFVLKIFNYKKECKSDDQGEFYIGRIFEGKEFTVEDKSGNRQFKFTVAKDAKYDVIIDRGTTFKIKVENQYGEAKPDFAIFIDGMEGRTDETGVYHSDYVILTPQKEITVTLADGSNPAKYKLVFDADENDFLYKITQEEKTTYKIKVENRKGEPKPNFAITVNGTEVRTDENAEYQSGKVAYEPGKQLQVSLPDGKCPTAFTLNRDEEANQFTYVVDDVPPIPEPKKMVTVRILTKKGNAIPNVPFKVLIKGKKVAEGVTNASGVGAFPAELLKHGQKYKIDFRVSREQEKNTDNQHQKQKNTNKNGHK